MANETDTKAAATKAAPTGEDIARRWMHENLGGGELSRNVECWNAVYAALPALGALIDAK